MRWRFFQAIVVALALIGVWTGWAELNPSDERALRTLVHDRLDDWFPELMRPAGDGHGLRLRQAAEPAPAEPIDVLREQTVSADTSGLTDPPSLNDPPGRDPSVCPRVLLIHGLDEPGIIWDDLAPAAAAAGFEIWELRYPNDQGVDRSAGFLAEHWNTLPDDCPVILVGHSMGGLLAREFVSGWRHPVGQPARVEGAPVGGVIMVGTPNQGSALARFRIWLELREHFEDARRRRFSLFAGLRDGLGEAKIDLRPGSDFLEALNARPWPESVPRWIIGARLVEPPKRLIASLDAAAAEVGSEPLREELHAWFEDLGEGLGDGAVSVESLHLEGAPDPVIVDGAHRTMLRRLFAEDPTPPAIEPIIDQLEAWTDSRDR